MTFAGRQPEPWIERSGPPAYPLLWSHAMLLPLSGAVG